jgi:hypothetical protein
MIDILCIMFLILGLIFLYCLMGLILLICVINIPYRKTAIRLDVLQTLTLLTLWPVYLIMSPIVLFIKRKGERR